MKMPKGAVLMLDNPAVKVWKWKGERCAVAKRLPQGHKLRGQRVGVEALKVGGMVEGTLAVMAKYRVQYPAANALLNQWIWS